MVAVKHVMTILTASRIAADMINTATEPAWLMVEVPAVRAYMIPTVLPSLDTADLIKMAVEPAYLVAEILAAQMLAVVRPPLSPISTPLVIIVAMAMEVAK